MQYNEFPKFVPDQLLTSEHLNQVFDYLDEQGRLTRTCLIGIGVVCGLQIETNATGTAITITKGCGVTSAGYLVQVPTTTYTEQVAFDPVKERYYDRFVDLGTKLKKFDLFELKQAGVVEESVPLTAAFLADKVVLLFVELLEEHNKNCDPSSCDDKGITVTVTFRPLLVAKANVAGLIGGGAGTYAAEAVDLPPLALRRVDVPATSLLDSAEVFAAFLKPLDSEFIELVERILSAAHTAFADLVADVYPANPFAGLAFRYRFLATGTMTLTQLLHTQYYYDLFSDLVQGYEELRRVARGAIALCCPEDTFPRHLLLGEAIGYTPHGHSDFRHYFIPSPILVQQPHLLAELRSLLIRLALLSTRFNVPAVPKPGGKLAPEFVRLTPSSLGDVPLSRKAIPYYYAVTQTPNPIHLYWDVAKTRIGEGDRNLSYHATSYNTHDAPVRQPLLFDLEPYNFLRAEGHIGQPYRSALASVLRQRTNHRLPIEVIALSTDARGVLTSLRDAAGRAASLRDAADLKTSECHFIDLESSFDALVKRLVCFLCKEMKYYYDVGFKTDTGAERTLVPTTALLKRCDPAFRYGPGSFGQTFENWFAGVRNQPYIPPAGITTGTTFSSGFFAGRNVATAPAAEASFTVVSQLNLALLFVVYYLEKLSETLVDSLDAIDAGTFDRRFADLQTTAGILKQAVAGQGGDNFTPASEDLVDHLDRLIAACDRSEMSALVAEFTRRWRMIEALRRLAYYARRCPGLQHKAGVPMGGTFVIVYHETSDLTLRAASTEFVRAGSSLSNLGNLTASLTKNRKLLDELIAEIPNGTVVADFYFPFICCSDCPPIHFEVVEREDPTVPPQISLPDDEFCGGSETAVPITVSPAGGTVTGEGVEPAATGGFVFVPAKVTVGDGPSKDVTLSYVVGGVSATLTVKVFNPPVAGFRLARRADLGPGAVEGIDTSKFATGWSWDFGDGSAPVTSQSATHTYSASGTFVVRLEVTNGPCSAATTAEINIQLQLPPTRLCVPVPALMELFVGIREVDPNRFDAFVANFPAFEPIAALFKALTAAGDLSADKEIQIHQEHKTVTVAPEWLNTLNGIFQANREQRVLAVEFFRVLTNLILRIACFQPEDIRVAKLPTADVFTLISRRISRWQQLAAETESRAKERIKIMLGDLEHEEARLRADEAATKPDYAAALEGLVAILRAYPF